MRILFSVSFASFLAAALAVAMLLCLPLVKTLSAPNAAPLKRHPDYKPPTLPPAMKKLQDPKYWAEQKKEFDALTDKTWANKSWTDNDAPYAALRTKIEEQFKTVSPQDLVARYAAPAKAHPNDPLAQFAWAYAVQNAIKSTSFPAQDAESTRFAAELALSEVPFPKTYNSARLRYLISLQSPGGGAQHFLKNLAYRLLQKDPNDFAVISGLIMLDSQNLDKTAQKEGYSLIQKMIKKYPEKPQVYDMLGGWHYAQYILYHKSSDYHTAMTNYQKALNMYPVTAARRQGLPQVMSFLTQRFHQISGS